MYRFCGEEITIQDNHAYSKSGDCLGYVFENNYSRKYLVGSRNKGPIEEIKE